MGNASSKLGYLLTTKNDIKTAIEGKGVTVPDGTTFRAYAGLIDNIEAGSGGGGSGGGSGGGEGSSNLQTGTATPTGEDFVLEPDEGYDGFSSVDVEGDINLSPENIVDGVTIYGVTGTAASADDLQIGSATPTGEDFTLEPDEGYAGFSSVDVEGDYNLKPENIADGVTIFGVTGTLVVGNSTSIPSEYDSNVTAAEGIYGGEYANKMILENNGYQTICFLMDDFEVTAYNSSTGEFSAIGWHRCSYNKDTGTWTQGDYTSTASSGGNFIKNCRYSSCGIYYNGSQIYPFPTVVPASGSEGTASASTGYLKFSKFTVPFPTIVSNFGVTNLNSEFI